MNDNKIKISLTTLIIITIITILCITGLLILILRKEDKTQNIISENNNDFNASKIQEIEEQPKAEDKVIKQATGVTVVPTMLDTVDTDSTWCGTFQLVWNDMKNKVVKKDIVFNPQLDIVKNLNKEDFNETMISEDYYYKIYGLKSLSLKEQIEKGIKEKFNQTSDILDAFDWDDEDNPNIPDVRIYFFYTMLYRKFEFLLEFDKLDNGKFGNKYNDVKYFGIDKNTKNSVGNQIDVLYYNSRDDFAVIVNTKTHDEVIFCKSPKGSNFNEIFDNMNNEAKKYTGSKSFKDVDEFKAPNLEFNEKREYTELEGKEFKTADPYYDTAEIQKAIQTIKLSLDEKGGEIKSEASIVMVPGMAIDAKPKEDEPRYFYVDDTFTIFLREKGKDKPYFAGRINDITKFQ